MRRPDFSAILVVVLAVAAAATLYAFDRGPSVGSAPSPSSTSQPTSTPSVAPSSSLPSMRLPFGDTLEGWTAFDSERYGFTIGHPADWTVTYADHDWTFATDAGKRPSTGQEVFRSPTGDITVSAWLVPYEPDSIQLFTPEGWPDVQRWVEQQYCQQTGESDCAGIGDRAVQMCNEARDCHPGLLVPFEDNVQAFFTGGGYEGMVVVAVWRAESDPQVAPYGGARQLLESFLRTMDVCPARQDMQPWGQCSQEPLATP